MWLLGQETRPVLTLGSVLCDLGRFITLLSLLPHLQNDVFMGDSYYLVGQMRKHQESPQTTSLIYAPTMLLSLSILLAITAYSDLLCSAPAPGGQGKRKYLLEKIGKWGSSHQYSQCRAVPRCCDLWLLVFGPCLHRFSVTVFV